MPTNISREKVSSRSRRRVRVAWTWGGDVTRGNHRAVLLCCCTILLLRTTVLLITVLVLQQQQLLLLYEYRDLTHVTISVGTPKE